MYMGNKKHGLAKRGSFHGIYNIYTPCLPHQTDNGLLLIQV